MRFGPMLTMLLVAMCSCATFAIAQETKHEEKPTADAAHPAEGAKSEAANPADEHAKPEAAHGKQDDAGHGHDSADLSHNNAGPSQSKPEEWKYDLAIWTLVVFLLLMVILGKFAWGPISEGLEKREHSIENMITDAKRNQEEAKALLANYEAKLAAQQEEYREYMAQARREGEAVQAKILSDAQAAASRERERAVTEIEQAKNVALGEIAAKSVDVAMGLAGKIVRRQITGEDQRALMRDAVEGIASRN